MLTGDKLETAKSIALSSRLISRAQTVYTFKQVRAKLNIHSQGDHVHVNTPLIIFVIYNYIC